MDENENLYFDLSHFASIKVSGADAKEFLQNQITANLDDLDSYGWLLTAWCLPNGRVLSNFILYETGGEYQLILPSMLKEKIIQRLTMFVLRSKVTISDTSDDLALIGLYGENTETVISQVDNKLGEYGKNLLLSQDTAVLRFDDAIPRVMMLIPMEKLKPFINRILMGFRESDRSKWSLLDIESGMPWITTSTSESFLPQMLNLDFSGGLSFKKGCYPGQEIIARLHYRGELKKRLFLGIAECDVTPGPGDELEDSKTGKLIGEIVDVEPYQNKQYKLLAVVNLQEDNNFEAKIRSDENSSVKLTAIENKAG